MNSARWRFGISTLVLMASTVAGGCSSSNSSSDSGTGDNGGNDAEATEGSNSDAPSGPFDATQPMDVAPCVPDSSILSYPIPDAEVNCFTCLEQPSACQSQLMQCGTNCDCAAAFGQFVQCIGTGTVGLTNCLQRTGLGTGLGANGSCASSCASACVPGGGGGDSGPPPGDGGSSDSAPAGDSGSVGDGSSATDAPAGG